MSTAPDSEMQSLQEALNIRRRMTMMNNPRNSLQLPESIEERLGIRGTLDKGIGILDEHLVKLRAFRNSLAPIFLLPDELLSQILYQHVLLSHPWSGGWTKVLFVCRKWRDVAMGDGRLWAFLTGSMMRERGNERMREWARRSRGHPLNCKFDHLYYPREPHPSIPSRYLPRVRTLTVAGVHTEVSRFLKGIDELPILEGLDILSLHDSESPAMENQTTLQIPAFMVEGRTPRLRSLSLSGVGFVRGNDWDLLANLTHLSLEIMPPCPVSMRRPSFSEFAEFLKHSPRLKDLVLRHYVDPEPSEIDHSAYRASIVLSDIQNIEINMDVPLVVAILESVVIPPTCSMQLIPFGIEVSKLNDDLSKLLVPLRRHLRHPRAPILRSMRLERSIYTSISAHTEPRCPERAGVSEKPHISILTHPTKQPNIRKVLTKIIHAFPLHTIEHLDVSPIMLKDWQLSRKSWRTLFGLLPISLSVEIGVNEAMLDMLSALLDAMRKGVRALPGGGRMRKRTPLHLQLSRLILRANINPSLEEEPVLEQQQMLYNRLMTLLREYRDLDAASKHRGIRVGTVEVGHLQRASYINYFRAYLHIYDVADQLSLLVDELFVEGRLWDLDGVEKDNAGKFDGST